MKKITKHILTIIAVLGVSGILAAPIISVNLTSNSVLFNAFLLAKI